MQLRISHYMAVAFATVLFLLLLLLGLSFSHMDQTEFRINQITEEHLAKQRLLNTMRDGIRVRQISLRTAVLLPRFEDRDREIQRFYDSANPVAVARNKLMDTALDKREQQLIEEINQAMSIAYPLQNELADDARFEMSIRNIEARLKEVFDAQARVINLLDDLSAYQTKLKTDASAYSRQEYSHWHDAILGIGLATFAFGILASLFIVRFTRRQESRVEQAMENMRELNTRLEQTVEERTRDLSMARDQALALSKTKSQFVANMSHELRTPLNAIIGYSEMLKEELETLDNPGITKDLDNIYAAGRQLHTLVDQVLDLSKVESGKLEMHPGWFDLPQFLDNIYRISMPTVTANRNRFSVHYADDIGRMYVDNMRLRQILLNLLNNAGKFTRDGEVTLSAVRQPRSDGDWITFTVSDTGIGIAPKIFSTIFQEFTQADSSTTRTYGGTGLGLAICQQLSVMMGGYITLDSQPGEGATFTVFVPAGNTSRRAGDAAEPPAISADAELSK